MTQMDARELLQDYYQRTGTHRTDLNALVEFVEARASGQLDDMKVVRLFWEMWNPRVMVTVGADPIGYTNDEPRAMPEDLEAAFLEILADLEREYRIYYEPDSESAIYFEAASRYVHVAAASALEHWRRDGFSDDVTGNLEAFSSILSRLGMRYEFPDGKPYEVEFESGETISIHGISAWVLGVLSQVSFLGARYEEALLLAVEALVILHEVEQIPEDEDFVMDMLKEAGFADVYDEEEFEEQVRRDFAVRREIRMGNPFSILSPQHLVDTFEGLKRQGKCDDWQMVVRHCDRLITIQWAELKKTHILVGDETNDTWNPEWSRQHWESVRRLSEALDGEWEGPSEVWQDYWLRAKGWAAAQLSPNEYRDLRRRDEMDASEQRLQLYFFGESWRSIPEKARERLINVDTLWFSDSRGLDYGSILNDLQVAAETMCYHFIWEPLLQTQGGPEQIDFERLDLHPIERGKSPTLAHYSRVCGSPLFKTFLRNRVTSDEQEFLTSILPTALQYLLNFRNPGQHDPKRRMGRDEVEPFVRRFLGIGREEIIRRLAEIGPKLARR